MFAFCSVCRSLQQMTSVEPKQMLYHEHGNILHYLKIIDSYSAHYMVKTGKGFIMEAEPTPVITAESIKEEWITDWDSDLQTLLKEGK